MKRQIRRGVFETNSSSVHSISIMTNDEYYEFCNKEMYLYEGYGWGFENTLNKPEKGKIYSYEEVIDFLKHSDYPPSSDFDWDDEDEVYEIIIGNDFYNSDYYFNRDYETFEKTYTTPAGEKIVAFGYYGHDY